MARGVRKKEALCKNSLRGKENCRGHQRRGKPRTVRPLNEERATTTKREMEKCPGEEENERQRGRRKGRREKKRYFALRREGIKT